jgi:GMP synthase-like glutamine amidotransferase
MRAHILQHVPFEASGCIADWLARRGATVSHTRFFEDPQLPGIGGLDLVIAMGGPMSVNDEAELPWLVPEKAFLREAMRRGVPVLGICLGAQLIASALGARVYPNRQKEIGWFELEGIPGDPGDFRFPDRFTALHWHGETFDLPPGARRLAGSVACRNQAFQCGERVIGLQFHLEATSGRPAPVGGQLPARTDPSPLRPVRSRHPVGLRPPHCAAANRLMAEVLDYLLGSPAPVGPP